MTRNRTYYAERVASIVRHVGEGRVREFFERSFPRGRFDAMTVGEMQKVVHCANFWDR